MNFQQKDALPLQTFPNTSNVSSPRVSRMVKKLDEKQDLIMKSTVIQDRTSEGIQIAKLDAEVNNYHIHSRTTKNLKNL